MNNPFTNNHFQCLEEESSSKFYSNKKYKKQESYDSNKNSFIKDREKTRTNYGENTIVENKKKNKFVKEMEKEKEEIKFNIKEFEFPEIGKVVSNNTNNIIAEQNLATTIADQQVQVGQQRATALAAILLGLQQEQHGNGKKYKKSKKSKKSKKIKKSKKSKKTKKSKKSKK